jgi:hypothetical protein
VVAIPAGEVVIDVTGFVTDRPSRTSIQVGEREHIDLPPGHDPTRVAVEFPWRFLNHSCDANTRLSGRAIVALRPIAAGDEITFDYRTTEYDMATPFVCRCGAASCRGQRIAGFRHLTSPDRERLLPIATEAVRACLAREARRSESAPAPKRGGRG